LVVALVSAGEPVVQLPPLCRREAGQERDVGLVLLREVDSKQGLEAVEKAAPVLALGVGKGGRR